jgi:dTDP-glucose pyrophosphorylase
VNLAGVLVPEGAALRQALELMTRSGQQIACVVDRGGRLVGLVTDGDLRRALLRGVALGAPVDDAMNASPLVADAGVSADEALALMRGRSIRHLPLLDADGRVVDVLRLEDLVAPVPPPLDTLAVIMAGGEGRRLRPLTHTTPKPLVKVGGKPLVEILIERLRRSGVVDVLVAVHHRSEMIREALGDGTRLGVTLAYVEEPKPLGTMGALTLVRDRLDRAFFVVNADILTKCDFRAMWEFHAAQAGAAMTVGVSLHQVDIPYGEFTLRGTRVTRVDEKPRKEFPINAGIYVVEPSVMDVVPVDDYFDATDLIRMLLDKGRLVAGYPIREYWLDVGHLHDFEKANRDVAEGLLE